MSTRGTFGFVYKDEYKVSYNHSDSYPEGLGVQVASFIKRNTNAEIRKIFKGIKIVENEEEIEDKNLGKIKQEIFKIKPEYFITKRDQINKAKNIDDLWYLFGHDIDAYENGWMYMFDATGFMFDSLFCEWSYTINLDTNKLIIYKRGRRIRTIPFLNLRKMEYEGIKRLMSSIDRY